VSDSRNAILKTFDEFPLLDPVAGIGTTTVEATLLGLDAFGIEVPNFKSSRSLGFSDSMAYETGQDRLVHSLRNHEYVLVFQKMI
jgi:hypothetical protein